MRFYQQEEDFRASSSEEDDQRVPWRNSYEIVEPCEACNHRPQPKPNLNFQYSQYQQPSAMDTSPNPFPPPVTTNLSSISMERTPSGHSIVSGTSVSPTKDKDTLTDTKAASKMIAHFRRRRRHLVEERILFSLLRSDAPLDNEALNAVLRATDKVFFHGRLAGRVRWEWSHPDSLRYSSELIGTTALRKAKGRDGYETLIVLSRPMLWSARYNRRLLLSTFLHEAVHCYLFIECGFRAMKEGGHGEGFRTISRVIDRWAGGLLQLHNTKTDLNYFEVESSQNTDDALNVASTTESDSHPQSQAKLYSINTTYSETTERISLLSQRLPRIDRARYKRVADMSRSITQDMQTFDDGHATNAPPRQGWSPFF